MTKYALLQSEVENARIKWSVRPYGFMRVVRYVRYRYLKHRLDSMPLYEAEIELEVFPRRRFL
jgi:hypothetical protein